MDERKLEFVSQIKIFSCVPPSQLNEIAQALQRRVYSRGEYVYHDSDSASGLFIVLRGAIKTFLTTPSGKQLTIAMRGAGGLFGQYSLFADKRDANAVALEDTEVLFLDRETYLKFLDQHPEAAIVMLRLMAASRKTIIERLYDVSMNDLPTRVAKALSELPTGDPSSGDDDSSLAHYLTQGELAGFVGATRESVNQCLRLFARQGWIEVVRGRIHILDRARLLERADLEKTWSVPPETQL